MADEQRAAIFGATGLVGGEVLDRLLASPRYERVIAIGRRAPARRDARLVARSIDLETLDQMQEPLLGAGAVVFCCLGTTIAKAGSQAEFRKVDRDTVDAAARFAARHGASQFLLVSAIGANARSPVFYNRIKGEAEAAVAKAGLVSVAILRPSLLLGKRAEVRWNERASAPFMRVLGLAMIGPARKWRPIEAATVAAAMVRIAEAPKPGVTILESDALARIGG